MLMFGLETTFRSLRRTRFHARQTWIVPVAISSIVVSLIALWLSAFLVPGRDRCFASLMFWTKTYSKPAIAFAGGIMLTHLVSGTIITIQLLHTAEVDRIERIAASRVVYSLGVDVLILVSHKLHVWQHPS